MSAVEKLKERARLDEQLQARVNRVGMEQVLGECIPPDVLAEAEIDYAENGCSVKLSFPGHHAIHVFDSIEDGISRGLVFTICANNKPVGMEVTIYRALVRAEVHEDAAA